MSIKSDYNQIPMSRSLNNNNNNNNNNKQQLENVEKNYKG